MASVTCGIAWIVPPRNSPGAFAGDHVPVYLAGGDVGQARQVHIYEPLVVAQIQVRLAAVFGYEHLAVLVGGHRSRIHVQIRIELHE